MRIAAGLLPRYAFSDAGLTALIAYVHTLDPERVPDATDSLLHFATIIAPSTDPAQRRVALYMLLAQMPLPQVRICGLGRNGNALLSAKN